MNVEARLAYIAAREQEIERYYATTPLNDQLEHFFEESEHGDRRWLRSSDLDVYVRRNRRDYGQVIAQVVTVTPYTKVVPILKTIDCLDIADVEFKNDENFEKWESFLKNAYRQSPWGAIYIDQVGHGKLQYWCKANRLDRVNIEGQPDRSDQSFYLKLPQRKNKIIAVSLADNK